MVRQSLDIDTLLAEWLEYINGDAELLSRVDTKGLSPSLDGRDVIELKLDHQVVPYTIRLKGSRFDLRAEEAENPCLRLTLSLSSFKRLALTEERIVWSLLDNEHQCTISPDVAWHDFITILEIFVALQELVDDKKNLVSRGRDE